MILLFFSFLCASNIKGMTCYPVMTVGSKPVTNIDRDELKKVMALFVHLRIVSPHEKLKSFVEKHYLPKFYWEQMKKYNPDQCPNISQAQLAEFKTHVFYQMSAEQIKVLLKEFHIQEAFLDDYLTEKLRWQEHYIKRRYGDRAKPNEQEVQNAMADLGKQKNELHFGDIYLVYPSSDEPTLALGLEKFKQDLSDNNKKMSVEQLSVLAEQTGFVVEAVPNANGEPIEALDPSLQELALRSLNTRKPVSHHMDGRAMLIYVMNGTTQKMEMPKPQDLERMLTFKRLIIYEDVALKELEGMLPNVTRYETTS